VGLEAQERVLFFGGIRHVHAFGRLGPFGDPEQPVEAHDMVHPKIARVTHLVAQTLGKILVPLRAAVLRVEWRTIPVLTTSEEGVRRSSDRYSRREEMGPPPGIVAIRVHSHGQVQEETGRDTARKAAQLFCHLPLAVKVIVTRLQNLRRRCLDACARESVFLHLRLQAKEFREVRHTRRICCLGETPAQSLQHPLLACHYALVVDQRLFLECRDLSLHLD